MFHNGESGQEVALLNTGEYKQSSEDNSLEGDMTESLGKVQRTEKQKPHGPGICLLKQEKAS